jgi:sugar/nucleoside kinase (ribokinase family)
MEMRRRGLTTSLDTNDDPDNKWESGLEEILPQLDILFCNEEELIKIAKTDLAVEYVSAKVPLLVVKRGGRGASAYVRGERIDIPSLHVDAVDSVGAGDSFDAGFLHQWVRQSSLKTCVAYGNLAGSLSVTRPGGTEAFGDSTYRQAFFERHWQNETLVL